MLTPAQSSYDKLLAALRKEIHSTQTRIRRLVDYEKVAGNWRIGKHIANHLLHHRDQARGEQRLSEQLADDLGTRERAINLAIQFYETYPVCPKESNISWSKYRILLTISDPKERREYERRISRENMTFLDLLYDRREIKALESPREVGPVQQLKCIRGKLYTYRIVNAKNIHAGKGGMMVDCGFDIRIEPPQNKVASFRGGDMVESIKTKDDYQVKHVFVPADALYTYAAFVERVIDGDTIIVNIDCGFDIWIRQRLRFRGIDAPEINTLKGKEAKKFVEDKLRGVDYIIIKTYGSDKFDRYLVDIFYLPGVDDARAVASEGNFLNQELLDAKLAVKWVP